VSAATAAETATILVVDDLPANRELLARLLDSVSRS
jgi:CheY-like chemotaxis protein